MEVCPKFDSERVVIIHQVVLPYLLALISITFCIFVDSDIEYSAVCYRLSRLADSERQVLWL